MIVKQIIDEDFVNYKKPSMVIAFPRCSWKCDNEAGEQVCQNMPLANEPDIDIDIEKIACKYMHNKITSAVVCAGLEPFDSFHDLFCFIEQIRNCCKCTDDIVIYTGYTEDEIEDKILFLSTVFDNIIVKFGRFVPGQSKHLDPILGVELASDNQYAKLYKKEYTI